MAITKTTKKQVRENVLAKIETALKDVAIAAHQKKFAKKLKKASHMIADFVWETNAKATKKVVVKKAAKKVAKPIVKKKIAKKVSKKAAK